MKITNRTFIKGTNWALAGIMGLLGFTCCDKPTDEYGTPYAEYKISGRVTNQSGKPISDIWIEIENEIPSGYVRTTYTDSLGGYELETETIGRVGKLLLFVSDVDGEKNGSYQNDTIQVAIEDKDYYDKGTVRKEVNFILKEKAGTDE